MEATTGIEAAADHFVALVRSLISQATDKGLTEDETVAAVTALLSKELVG
jgi:hypothetical protein